MRILVIRHAVAQDREEFKLTNDDLRPLAPRGKKEFEQISKIYKKIYPDIEALYSSSLLRATQTSDILKKRYQKSYKIWKELSPSIPPSRLMKKIRKTNKKFIAIVGHEPSLSEFIGYALTGKSCSIIEMKKGGACLLNLERQCKILAHHNPKNILKLSKS